MKCGGRVLKSLLFSSLVLVMFPALVSAQHYQVTNLVSDIPGMAPTFDRNLQNPWGITRSAGGPWWVSNNNSGTSTLYDGAGNIFPSKENAVVVIVPPPASTPNATSTPTGIVYNGSAADFHLKNGKAAHFIFATEDGTISAWAGGASAELKVDNSDGGSGAVYKGATSAEINGKKFLYVTNFRSGKVEVYDTTFKPAHLGEDAFSVEDEEVPAGFAPFNVQNIGGELFVTYAKQDSAMHDPLDGDGFGYVEIFTPQGKHIGRLEHGSWLDAPWGVVWTTRDFGEFSNAILVGNFRNGWIAAYDGFTHKFLGLLKNPDDTLVTIDGLWALTFGNDQTAGLANTLYFSAGIQNEVHGLFGTLTPTDGLDGDEE